MYIVYCMLFGFSVRDTTIYKLENDTITGPAVKFFLEAFKAWYARLTWFQLIVNLYKPQGNVLISQATLQESYNTEMLSQQRISPYSVWKSATTLFKNKLGVLAIENLQVFTCILTQLV